MGERTLIKNDFLLRLDQLQPGERLTYHAGNILRDRQSGPDFGRVHATAAAAWDAMNEGKAHLAQVYRGNGVFEYMAIKRAAPYQKPTWAGCYAPAAA